MHANQGDKLVVESSDGSRPRTGLIRSVSGPSGNPPYEVEWVDEPGVHTVWPGPDARIETLDHPVVD